MWMFFFLHGFPLCNLKFAPRPCSNALTRRKRVEYFLGLQACNPPKGLGSPSRMADDLDDFDDDDDDDDEWDYEEERLECSASYLLACILLPFLDGNLTAFAWPGYTLHYAEMGWPAVNAGLSVTIGYAMRVVCQQMQRTAGFWIAIPFAMIHLAIAFLAFFFTTSEWAIFLEVVAFICFEPLAVIEGIAFDTFGSSETLARQATSTVLSVFTLSKAMACTLGGVVYDALGWKGVAMYHVTWCVQRFLLILHFAVFFPYF